MRPENIGKSLVDRFKGKQHYLSGTILVVILGLFYRDIILEGRTFLMETAARGTMPQAGPYNYKGVSPGFVANDPGAIASQTEPFNRFISASLKQGDFPLWNPYAGLAGSPLLADGHTGPLEPLQFLFFFLPNKLWPLSIDFQLLIRFFIAGFACYLFACRQGINLWGSVAAGTLFMLSSYFVTYGNHPQIKTEALLPLVLYGYDRLVNPNDRLGFWICALFIAWAIIAAMPESTFFGLFLGTLWYFYKSLCQSQNNDRSCQYTRNPLLRYSGSTLLGFLISSAYLLPFLEYMLVAKSTHSPGTGSDSYRLELLPGLIFQIRTIFYLHMGFFAVFSLIYSLLNLRDRQKYGRHIVFFSLYAVTFILVMFDFPLISWIRKLPVFNQLVLEKYPVPSINFCLAILTGIFIESAKNLPLSYKKLSLSLLIIIIIFIGIPRIRDFESLSTYSSDLKFIYSASGLIIAILIVLYVLSLYQRKRIFSQHLVQISLFIMITLEPFFWETRINRPQRFDPFQVPPFVSYLNKKEGFRIFGLDSILYPNISTAYRISDIRWLNALVPQRAYNFSIRFIESREPNSIRFTGTVLPLSDEMFNMLNVKYILRQNSYIEDIDNCAFPTDDQPYFGRDTVNPLIIEQNQGKKDLFPELPLNINGATRMSILAQPPQSLDLSLLIPKEASKLDFSIGLHPKIFLPEYGDGVTFKIILIDQDNKVEVFSKHIDPKNIPCDRKWFDESIRLEKWAGKEVVLRFRTTGGPLNNTSYDLAYWGDIRLAAVSKVKQKAVTTSYHLVYQDQDVLIYQNEDVLPRAFMTYRIVNVSSLNDSLTQLANPNINLGHTVVVENLPTQLENMINKNNSPREFQEGKLILISSDELDIKVNTESPGLLVLSDQYYPGWRAYVDGRLTPIYPVNSIFRGVFLDTGNHVIEFRYRPQSFIIGGIISAVSLITTIYFIILYAILQRKNHE
jgi:hypothetical protein